MASALQSKPTVRRTNDTYDEIEVYCQGILRYLVENPKTRDTLQGIAEWWLLEHDVERDTGKVRQALARLVAKGLLRQKHGPDGRVHYLLEPQQLDAVRQLIAPGRERSQDG